MTRYDYVIVGSGIAGLFAALLAKDHGSVLILTKGSIDECNTKYAQGGIAAPVGPDDSPDLHYRDTIAAGAGLVDEEAARILTSEATERIADLVRFGVPFDSVEGHVALGREGAHSRARVLHAGGDSTGEKIELSLSSLARMSAVTVREYCLARRDPDGGRHGAWRRGHRRALRRARAVRCPLRHPGDRRRGPALQGHDEPRRSDGGRRRAGVSSRRGDSGHGVHSVPSDGAAPARRARVPHLGSGPRRGRRAAQRPQGAPS